MCQSKLARYLFMIFPHLGDLSVNHQCVFLTKYHRNFFFALYIQTKEYTIILLLLYELEWNTTSLRIHNCDDLIEDSHQALHFLLLTIMHNHPILNFQTRISRYGQLFTEMHAKNSGIRH